MFKLLLKILIPIAVLVASAYAAKTIVDNRPEARTRPSFSAPQAVDATRLQTSDYPVIIRTQGTVRPGRESTLVPEVTGIIRTMSPNFVVGGYFEAGEVLISIDRRDYDIALSQANATFAQASASLQEEQARADQAVKDWKSLGRKGNPSALTARVPQVAAARASLAAARASVQRAQLDLERTEIIAPYAGRVLERGVDEGEFVSRGAPLGRIHSIDRAEVKLPLSSRQQRWLQGNDSQANGTPQVGGNQVTLSSSVAGETATWEGTLIRSEGIDVASQQLNVIVGVPSPFTTDSEKPPLRVGQFVTAEIAGQTLEDVIVIPRSSLREDREVLLVGEDGKLEKREVTVAWSDDTEAAITEGLAAGEVLILTALGAAAPGIDLAATIDGEKPESPQRPSRPINASGGAVTGAEASAGMTVDGIPPERLQRFRQIVDSGGQLPERAVAGLRKRVEAGETLPEWLQNAIQ